jgi:hypothetical protein
MAKKNTYTFTVKGFHDLVLSEKDNHILLAAELTWKEAPSVFKKTDIDFGVGGVTFNADWKNCSDYIIETITKLKELDKASRISKEEVIGVLDELRNLKKEKEDDVKITVTFNTSSNPLYILQVYLTFVFMALNIAAPGCAALWNLKISPADEHLDDSHLSPIRFLGGWDKSIELGWPTIEKIDLTAVTKWLCNNEIFKGQVSKGRIQRIVYALLNVCARKWPDPMETIWLSQALEAIVDSPSSNVSKLLKDRLFLLIGRPNNINKVKQLINSFYNFRSRIVHGDFDICHPQYNELIDKKVDEYIESFEEQLNLATGIIISTLQKMVKNKWSKVEFEERLLVY